MNRARVYQYMQKRDIKRNLFSNVHINIRARLSREPSSHSKNLQIIQKTNKLRPNTIKKHNHPRHSTRYISHITYEKQTSNYRIIKIKQKQKHPSLIQKPAVANKSRLISLDQTFTIVTEKEILPRPLNISVMRECRTEEKKIDGPERGVVP